MGACLWVLAKCAAIAHLGEQLRHLCICSDTCECRACQHNASMQQGTVPSATCDGRGLPEAPKVLRKRASNMAVRCCGSSPFFGAGTRSLDEKAATAAARRCDSTCVNVFIQSSCATQTSCQTNSHTFLLRTDVLLTQRSPSARATTHPGKHELTTTRKLY